METANKISEKINLVVADMGYGHQRAAFPLRSDAGDNFFLINDYPEIKPWEKEFWSDNLGSYEKISRWKDIPLIGDLIFSGMDYLQRIEPFAPGKKNYRPSLQQLFFYFQVYRGLGKCLINRLKSSRLPLVTSFFVAAYAAEYYRYSGDIYCIVCDSDISRAWAPLNGKRSRIKYLAPNKRVFERLQSYGVKKENIFITGFPLPKENIGQDRSVLVSDFSDRISRLDPNNRLENSLRLELEGAGVKIKKTEEPITITYAVGGAGAQKEIGVKIIEQLKDSLLAGKYKVNLVAGVRLEVRDYFQEEIDKLGLSGESVRIIYAEKKDEYFRLFNEVLRRTDILWTKPSELSFYCALGLPFIASESVGAQEDFNLDWLKEIGAVIPGLDPEEISKILPELIANGSLAEAAANGFLKAEAMGVYHIESLLNL